MEGKHKERGMEGKEKWNERLKDSSFSADFSRKILHHAVSRLDAIR
jgi:hypothetical protein